MLNPVHSVEPPTEPIAVSMREAARLCSLSERTIWGAIKDGRLKATRIGRSVRVTLDAIREFLDSHQA